MRRGLASLLLVALGACANPVRVEHSWTALGGEARAEIQATSESIVQEIVAEIDRGTRRVEAALDPANPESELEVLNRRAVDQPYPVVDRDLYVCIKRALDYAKASEGAYDPTVGPLLELYARRAASGTWPDGAEIEAVLPDVGWQNVTLFPEAHAVKLRVPGMRLDLRAMADGLVLDAAARAFARVGSRAALLELRGALQSWGMPLDGEIWRVPLPDPRRPESRLGTLPVDNRGIGITSSVADPRPADVTAGRALLDPRSGRPTGSDVRVAVAVAEGAADASAISAALLLGGSLRAGALLSKTYRVEALLLVERDGKSFVMASASMRGRLELSAELREEVAGRVRYILPPDTIALPALGFGRH